MSNENLLPPILRHVVGSVWNEISIAMLVLESVVRPIPFISLIFL